MLNKLLNKTLLTALAITSSFFFSSNLLAQNENTAQNAQPSLADRIEKDLPQDIKVNNDFKTSALVNNTTKKFSNFIANRTQLSSLMFNEEQQYAITAAIESLRNGVIFAPQDSEDKEKDKEAENKALNKKTYIYLASIMYVNNDYWAVWINGEKITSDSNAKTNEIYLENVQRDKVSVLWTISESKWKILMGVKADEMQSQVNAQGQVEKRFELKPNQTFLLLYETVIEGNAQLNSPIISKNTDVKTNDKNKSGQPNDPTFVLPTTKTN
ncbi:MAG: hypothetical protein KGQ36_06510 [Rickettsiales bacterium]|nr:hypothetical protein [Rickettsiales bacterium]